MRTSGFDLASADERTAGCIVGWTESGSPLALLRPLDNATVVELARDVEIVASTLRWDGLRPDEHARDGSNGLLEVYPAAALKRWSLSSRGYKLPENTAERSSILAALQHCVDLDLGGFSDGLTRSSDGLHALVSSMVARAYFLGDTDAIPDEHRNEAAVEGWISRSG